MVRISDGSLVNLISFLFWSGIYLHTALNWPEKNPEWNSRAITLLHGSVATIVGLCQCDLTHLSEWRLNKDISRRHYALMVWSWGYFAFDLLWCLLYQPEGRLILCHHVSALVAITLYMQKEHTGCTFACNMVMMEVTNPLLQTRWFLKYEGYGKTTLFYIVEAAYVLGFVVVRGLLGSYVVFKIVNSDMFDVDEKIISVVFFCMSVALLYQVIGYVLYRYKPLIQQKEEGLVNQHRS